MPPFSQASFQVRSVDVVFRKQLSEPKQQAPRVIHGLRNDHQKSTGCLNFSGHNCLAHNPDLAVGEGQASGRAYFRRFQIYLRGRMYHFVAQEEARLQCACYS
jgi:hypothetical protein